MLLTIANLQIIFNKTNIFSQKSTNMYQNINININIKNVVNLDHSLETASPIPYVGIIPKFLLRDNAWEAYICAAF